MFYKSWNTALALPLTRKFCCLDYAFNIVALSMSSSTMFSLSNLVYVDPRRAFYIIYSFIIPNTQHKRLDFLYILLYVHFTHNFRTYIFSVYTATVEYQIFRFRKYIRSFATFLAPSLLRFVLFHVYICILCMVSYRMKNDFNHSLFSSLFFSVIYFKGAIQRSSWLLNLFRYNSQIVELLIIRIYLMLNVVPFIV